MHTTAQQIARSTAVAFGFIVGRRPWWASTAFPKIRIFSRAHRDRVNNNSAQFRQRDRRTKSFIILRRSACQDFAVGKVALIEPGKPVFAVGAWVR